MAKIRPIGDLAHELETLYEGLSDGRYVHTPELAQLLQRSHDQLAVQLEQLQARQPMSDALELLGDIRAYRQTFVPAFEVIDAFPEEQGAASADPVSELDEITVEEVRPAELIDASWLISEESEFQPDAQAVPESVPDDWSRSEEHTSELQSRENLVCRLLL